MCCCKKETGRGISVASLGGRWSGSAAREGVGVASASADTTICGVVLGVLTGRAVGVGVALHATAAIMVQMITIDWRRRVRRVKEFWNIGRILTYPS